MSDDIRTRVITMLKENLEDADGLEKLNPDYDLSSFGINSVTFIKLVIAAEMEFGFSWNDDDLDYKDFSTVNNIVEYIKRSESGNG
jgi:acyl carrier protein